MSRPAASVSNPSAKAYRSYSALVGGKLIAAKEREALERASPATGALVGLYPSATEADTIEVNTYIAGEPELPLSGYGDSGLGHEKSRFAVDEFTRLKTVQLQFGRMV